MKRTWWSITLTLALLAGLLWAGATPTRGAGFVVVSNADDQWAHDVNPGDCDCGNTWDDCTLRAAIEEANACPGADTITFQTAMDIYLDTNEGALPQINEALTIDASSVWAGDGPGVTIYGQNNNSWGLGIGADSCQIYGLYITGFKGSAIYVFSASNTIGGSGAGQRNVLSGNSTGLTLIGSSAQFNAVRNNYLGLTPAGNTKNPNGTGLIVAGGASDNTVGGDHASQGNFISGNDGNGVRIQGAGSDGNRLANNAIGLGADKVTDLGNAGYGVWVDDGPINTVIGGAEGWGNLIVYNGNNGVTVSDASSYTQISYNLIGSNDQDGVSIYDTPGCLIQNNLINGNQIAGVRVDGAAAAGNLIWPNSITGSGFKGIRLQDGGNMNIAAPTITKATSLGASGSGACANCLVAVYSDSGNQGQVYHGIATANGAGQWSYTGLLVGPNITATTIDGSGNTSEFSAPRIVVPAVFLPLVVRSR